MNYFIRGDLVEGIFLKRLNRFVAEVLVDNKKRLSHVPNTGRMKELLVKGEKVILRRVKNRKRKTKFDLLMVYKNDILVQIDSKIPNILLYNALKENNINCFNSYNEVKREVTYGNSRFDIALKGRKNTLIEAKCVTYVRNKVAKFPDAPTIRGTKHVNELIKAKREGFNAAIFFIIQRNDAEKFTPNRELDPDFSKALEKAYKEGVVVKAMICQVNKEKISLSKEIEVYLR